VTIVTQDVGTAATVATLAKSLDEMNTEGMIKMLAQGERLSDSAESDTQKTMRNKIKPTLVHGVNWRHNLELRSPNLMHMEIRSGNCNRAKRKRKLILVSLARLARMRELGECTMES